MEDRGFAHDRDGESDPAVAIIGIGCRFPGGVDSPDTFWALLRNGVDAVTMMPEGRWNPLRFHDPNPEAPGKTISNHGGFLANIDQFDEQFFGMSPREAERADPQQRLMLELAFEALEDSGTTPKRMRGIDVGVFVGISSYDYGGLQSGPG